MLGPRLKFFFQTRIIRRLAEWDRLIPRFHALGENRHAGGANRHAAREMAVAESGGYGRLGQTVLCFSLAHAVAGFDLAPGQNFDISLNTFTVAILGMTRRHMHDQSEHGK